MCPTSPTTQTPKWEHLRGGSTDREGSAGLLALRESQHAKHTTVECDQGLSTSGTVNSSPLRWKPFDSLEVEDRKTSSTCWKSESRGGGGQDGWSTASSGTCKKPLVQMVSVTVQVAILWRVFRFNLRSWGRQGPARDAGGLGNFPTPVMWELR